MTRLEFATAVALDFALGDPRWLPHPVRGIGWIISRGERWLRKTNIRLRAAGVVLCLCVTGATAAVVWITVPAANIYWAYAFLALRCLDTEATRVIASLEKGDIASARLQLSYIVGRDTADLDEAEIVRAVVETVAENLSDGVVAPLLYLALLGPIGMAAYKAVNTLDSMVGYRDDKYRELGWASARIDDLLNYVPARVSAALIWTASALLRMDTARSIRIALRDADKQPSPNSGWPEASFAGALQVRLGGVNRYRGAESRKAFLCDPDRNLDASAFRAARRLLYVSAAIAIAGVFLWL